ncbi:MAG: phosphoribosylformylglycinamidine synthase subunit PurS [Candidatus Neomarinimicrobiota bacterium]|mgnify:FL=1|nr:phosphoribosylformylglycinamidine synthase subunit PurS [Candidatus Neomarinimicrobiota bacterium]|tara:strand:+ start:1719 stop:1961 length:243 start_codon:yes stop_codon:yes gene_type:complete
MKAKIYISYKEGILDPQGQTINHALNSIGINKINSVRMGKYIEMEFNGISKDEADKITDESCRKLLANPNTETYNYELTE